MEHKPAHAHGACGSHWWSQVSKKENMNIRHKNEGSQQEEKKTRENFEENTNSFLIGKNPSSPSVGIIRSLGLKPVNHGDAFVQLQYLPK